MEPFRACKLSRGLLQCPPTLPNPGRTRACKQPCLTGTCSTLRLWWLLPAPSTHEHVLRVALEPAIMGHRSSSWMQLYGMFSSIHVVPSDRRLPCSDSRWLSIMSYVGWAFPPTFTITYQSFRLSSRRRNRTTTHSTGTERENLTTSIPVTEPSLTTKARFQPSYISGAIHDFQKFSLRSTTKKNLYALFVLLTC